MPFLWNEIYLNQLSKCDGIFQGELPIAMALASVVATPHMDELARVFVNLFDAKHLLYQLLWNMFSKEVRRLRQSFPFLVILSSVL
jgi:hypothetical protein